MLKNKLFILSLFIIFVSIFYVSKTFSFFTTQTKGKQINLKMSEWVPAESNVLIFKDDQEYSLDEIISPEVSNDFQQNFTTEDNHYLSFQYKINSTEDALGFDQPNFIAKLNGEIVYQAIAKNNLWNRGYINLSKFKSDDNNYQLEFSALNTFDENHQPDLELKEISTSRYLAKQNDLLIFTVSKQNSNIHLKYIVEENGILTRKEKILSAPFEFPITEHFYDNQIEYFSVDSFGNIEDSKFLIIDTDFEAPKKIENIDYFVEGDFELGVVFNVPTDNFSSPLELYQLNILNSDQFFQLSNHKKYGVSTLPLNSELLENILFTNLPAGKNNYQLRSIDVAGNQSDFSNPKEITIN